MASTLRRLGTSLLLALGMVSMWAVAAFASTTPTAKENVNAAVSSAATDAKDVITTNIPVILGVLGVAILLAFGLKMVRKVKGAF